ncbi:hypothetical protein WA171_002394 [Blastocystis sp. BT1]
MDGSYNFYYAPEFELRSCDSLKSLSFGNRAFVNTLVFRIHDMPHLQTISVGNRAFFGKKIRNSEDHMVNASRFSWRNLPALKSLSLNNNFVFYRGVTISNAPNCDTIVKASKCFPSKEFPIELEGVSQKIRESVVSS